MTKDEFDKYLVERYENQIEWYDSRANLYKRLYQVFQWFVIILSSIVPVLIVIVPEEKQIITIAVSVLLSIGTSGLKSFNFQENWINYRTTAETLKKEKYYYEAEIDDYFDCDDKIPVFVERVESLISRENSLWFTAHRKKEKEEKEGC